MPPRFAGDSRNTREPVFFFRAGMSAEGVAGGPREQPSGEHKGKRRNRKQQRNHRDDKQPVSDSSATLFVGVPIEEREVHLVRFPAEVEEIAGHGYGTDQRVDRGVEDHSQLHDLREAEIVRLPEQADGEKRRREVTHDRDETNDWIEADAIARAGHDESGVEQLGRTTQGRQPRVLCWCERSEPDNSQRPTPKFQDNPYFFSPHRINTVPTVNPAPTDARRSKSPSLSRFCSTASLSASGIVPAVVLPKRSMLMTTFSCGIPSFSVADRMMRRFAWCDTKRSISHGLTPLRSRIRRAASSVLRTANLNTVAPSCFT